MSTQRLHFLTIVGRSAQELEAACEAIMARRPADQEHLPTGRLFSDYTPAMQARLDALCQSLVDAADALPVVHHATHIDGWAMSNYGLDALPWPDGCNRAIGTMGYGIAIYPQRQAAAILVEAEKVRRRTARRKQGHGAWYANGVATAIHAGQMFKLDYIAAAVTECMGPTREDYEIADSQRVSIPQIARYRNDPAVTKQYAERDRFKKGLTRALQRCATLATKTSSTARARN